MFCKIAVSAITGVVTYEPVPYIARAACHFYEHPASMSVAALWLLPNPPRVQRFIGVANYSSLARISVTIAPSRGTFAASHDALALRAVFV
ncbi:unnamed protein product [Heligmosomoides polygyrus]|uniref:Secreted protein n=1 Tax=Heligmosomoides polygyrus TaxID=6339 RepID=A0A183G4L1_HELPZ|nr:unnamed protein product [Heligmosomoides polygyrus]